MATVVNPPSSRFRAAILQHGLSAGGTEKSGASKGLENPLLGSLGDPSLNQTFSGPFAGLAQYGQSVRQHQAFQKQNADLEQTMNKFGDAIKEAGGPGGMVKFFQDNPKALLTFHAAGIDPQKLIQPFMTGQPGIQTHDLSGGGQVVIVRGEDGKSTTHVVQPHNGPAPRTIGVDANNNVVTATGNGPDTPHPGVTPPSVVNNQNTQAGANGRQTARLNAAAAAGWKQDTNGNWINTKAAGGPVDQDGNPAQRAQAKMSPQEEQYFGHALNLHDALSVLHDYSNPVANPITGRISTLGAKLFGINDDALIYQQALKAAKGEMASMGETGANNKFALQTKLDQLPVDYHSARAGLLGANVDLQNLRDTMGTRAAAVEAKGTMAPAIADKLADRAHVYVPSRANQDPINILKKNPDAMNDDQLDQVFQYRDTLKPNDRAIVMQQIARRVGTNAAAESAQPPQQPAPVQQAAPQQQPVAPAGQPLAPAVTPRPEPSAGVP